MTRRYQAGCGSRRGRDCGADGPAALRLAEQALNDAISAHGINSGEVFAARWQVDGLRRRLRRRAGVLA